MGPRRRTRLTVGTATAAREHWIYRAMVSTVTPPAGASMGAAAAMAGAIIPPVVVELPDARIAVIPAPRCLICIFHSSRAIFPVRSGRAAACRRPRRGLSCRSLIRSLVLSTVFGRRYSTWTTWARFIAHDYSSFPAESDPRFPFGRNASQGDTYNLPCAESKNMRRSYGHIS